MTETGEFEANDGSLVTDAFRSPPPQVTANKSDGLRVSVIEDQPLRVHLIRTSGFAAVWGLLFPNATVVQLSGKFNAVLRIYPTHVQIGKRRWYNATGALMRYVISIPVYNEIGDAAVHQLHVRSALAFLYPFVPMHVQVTLDDDVAFSQGKFQS